MTLIDHKTERGNDVNKIKESVHPRRVVVAGPGTGKSFLFSELIKKKRAEGKTNFLAITFIGKLGDNLADDLCGLATTMTLHGFARDFVLKNYRKYLYYPRIKDIIGEDLEMRGIKEFEIGDKNYAERTIYYHVVGDDDVIYYAVQICKKHPDKIPSFDLILVDEYQDFNSIESEFVDLLSQNNEMVIVGDDDQALYEFKGSSPSFIREKYNPANTYFESHTLRFCSRCTEVIIKYFHNLVSSFNLNDEAKERIPKDYICYLPEKKNDSDLNSKIHLLKNWPIGKIAITIRYELEEIIKKQKIKDVLIIGEGRSCKQILKQISMQLENAGFKNIEHKDDSAVFNIKQNIVDAYKFINQDESSLLGWRILGNPAGNSEKEKHLQNAKTLDLIIKGTPSVLKKVKDSMIDNLELEIEEELIPDKEIRKNLLFQNLKKKNIHLSRPLSSLNITVCNILNSKGLGADIVFLVGFDQGKFPIKEIPQDSEIYQMLVAVTRAKKRIYLINTIGKEVSGFIDCIENQDLVIRE